MDDQQSQTISPPGSAWYAVSVRSRHEKVAAAALACTDIPTFLPLLTEVHRWSDRKKIVTVPLFTCYLFVRLAISSESRVRVLRAPGTIGFVGDRRGPLPIPDKEIEDVRSVLAEKTLCSPYPFLKVGERVRIIGGALDGIEGILIGRGPDTKLVISIELVLRSLAISVYHYNVKPISGSRGVAA